MPQDGTPAQIKAEASSEETKQFVRRVRRVTRRKFTPEEKVRVVLEGFRGEVKVSELCRREDSLVDFVQHDTHGSRVAPIQRPIVLGDVDREGQNVRRCHLQ